MATMTKIETVEQREARERDIATKRQVIAFAENAKASAEAIIARLQREIAELEQP